MYIKERNKFKNNILNEHQIYFGITLGKNRNVYQVDNTDIWKIKNKLRQEYRFFYFSSI